MIEKTLQRGTLISVIVVMMMLLGTMAALRVPIQMIPDLDVRTITIQTRWPGATPQDVEKEIIIEQEKYLRGLAGLRRMVSQADTGNATIQLEFPFGTDVNEALIRVNNALSQVSSYPENVDEPTLYSNSQSNDAFMAFRVHPLSGNPRGYDMDMMRDYVDDHIRTVLERIPGVSQVEVNGGAERQIQILIDAPKLSEYGISLTQLRDTIRARNSDWSAGDLESGKRRYLVRTTGRFKEIEDLENLIIQHQGDSVLRLRDVAVIRLDHFELRNISYTNGESNIRVSLRRENGANVIQIKKAIIPLIEQLNRDVLHPEGLQITLSNDDVRYVEASIENVWQNLLIGAVLAIVIMYAFLRSASATLIGVSGVPICTLASFIGLLAAGRTLNVISLAGVAFAIGMTLDNTIVVLESIQQERQRGHSKYHAALIGTQRVWSAVLAATLTTVLVFLPVMFIKEEAGQLFSDIAIAISAAILFSMIVAIFVVPVAYIAFPERKKRKAESLASSSVQAKPKQTYFERFNSRLIGSLPLRILCMLMVIALTLFGILKLTPPAEYLPEGEEAKAFSTMIAPPGYNLLEMERISEQLHKKLLPLLQQDPVDFDQGKSEFPALSRLTIVASAGSLRIIAETTNPAHIDAYIQKINAHISTFPGMRAFTSRGSIISSNDGGTRSVNLDISGPDLNSIYLTAQTAFRHAGQVMENPQINSTPSSLILGQPLLEIHPKWERLSEINLSPSELGYSISSLTDGAFVDEFILNDDKIDIFFYSGARINPERIPNKPDPSEIGSLLIHTPQSGPIPISSLADFHETVDTANIRRVDGKRTVTLNIIPPRSIPLETAVQIVNEKLVNEMKRKGEVPPGVSLDISGASDQLDATRKSLGNNLWVALALCWLQLVVIYRHWGWPLVILTTVPMGISGGIIGLWLMNFFGAMLPHFGMAPIQQPFDMITMLGFLILLGVVLNNPILIVDLALRHWKEEGMSPQDSVKSAVKSRLRAILMSTITTLCGLAPLVFIPGAGTELYRGVGAVVLFGLFFSTLVTLTFLPSLLTSLFEIFDLWKKTPSSPPSQDFIGPPENSAPHSYG